MTKLNILSDECYERLIEIERILQLKSRKMTINGEHESAIDIDRRIKAIENAIEEIAMFTTV